MANPLSMRLMVDKKCQRVLYAEAKNDVVDLLFGLLGMSIRSIVKLLATKRMAGCFGNIYQSVNSLEKAYFLPDQDKDVLLNSSFNSPPPPLSTLLLETNASSLTVTEKNFACKGCFSYTNDCGTICPSCNLPMTQEMKFIQPKAGKVVTRGRYVKDLVTYMVMDDLSVMPMSTTALITLFKRFPITDVDSLEERVVVLDMEHGLELVRASLQSTTVLTDVFLGKDK